MPARFKADSTFTITGRGLVVAGEILEGSVKAGMRVQISSWPSPLTISSVEHIQRTEKQPANVGLLFMSRDEAEYTRWRALDLKGQILELQGHEGEPGAGANHAPTYSRYAFPDRPLGNQ